MQKEIINDFHLNSVIKLEDQDCNQCFDYLLDTRNLAFNPNYKKLLIP